MQATALRETLGALAAPRLAPLLSMEERDAIGQGRWFASLSPALRHDLLRHAQVRRLAHGEDATRGSAGPAWTGVARGVLRIGWTARTGRRLILDHAGPGAWLGDAALFDGGAPAFEAVAHGQVTLLGIHRLALQSLLSQHVELQGALLRLQGRLQRRMAAAIEDLATLPLRARLAQLLLRLAREHGVLEEDGTVRITLPLVQDDLADWLGGSRQRINFDLKSLERAGWVRLARGGGLFVLDRSSLEEVVRGAA